MSIKNYILVAMMVVLGRNAQAQNLPPYIIKIDANSTVVSLTDGQLLQRGAVVRFKVNRAELPQGDKGYAELVNAVQNVSKNFDICRMLVIRGSASPEGSYQNNVSLAHRRAKALAESLSPYISIPDSLIEERYVNEDYEGLRQLLSASDAPYKNRVIAVIDKYKGNAQRTKQALRSLSQGRVWRALLTDYFPQLRASRVVLFVSEKKQPVPKEIPVIAEPTPKADSLSLAPITTKADSATVNEEPKTEVAENIKKETSHVPWLNIKTNVLYDLALFIPQYGYAPTPNISVEYLPSGGHITPVAELMWSGWRSDSRSKTWIVRNILLEGRYYIKGESGAERRAKGLKSECFTGHYFSVYGNMGKYDLQVSKTKGWLGDKFSNNYGFGLGWGYVRRFKEGSRWKWEVNAALGYLHSDYDSYHAAEDWAEPGNTYFDWHENPADYHRYGRHLNYFGITRLGVSLSVDLF